jgi:hypothetical protein
MRRGADRVRALAAGFNHLTKPIDPRLLIEAIYDVSFDRSRGSRAPGLSRGTAVRTG